jgi:hypothetical protein
MIIIPLKSRLCRECCGTKDIVQSPLVYIDREGNEFPSNQWAVISSPITDLLGLDIIPYYSQLSLRHKYIKCPNCKGSGQEKYVDLTPLENIALVDLQP